MYSFILAERLGMTVRELLERMDSVELSEWMAFDRVRDPSEEWIRHAALMNHVAQLWGSGRSRYEDYLPRRSRPDQSPQQTEADVRAIMASFRGR